MKRTSLVAIIAIALIGFILFKGAASLLCQPQQQNSVAHVISEVASNITTPPEKAPPQADPLSWEPFFHLMINLFTKACPR